MKEHGDKSVEAQCVSVSMVRKHSVPGLEDSYDLRHPSEDILQCFDELKATGFAKGACSKLANSHNPVIFTMRYPGAIALSWWHFFPQEEGRSADQTAADIGEATTKKLAVFYHWAKYYAPRVFIVQQMELYSMPVDTLEDLTRFMYRHASHDTVAKVALEAARATNFTALKQRGPDYPDSGTKERPKYWSGDPFRFMRELSPQTLDRIEQLTRENMQPELVALFEEQGYFDRSNAVKQQPHPVE